MEIEIVTKDRKVPPYVKDDDGDLYCHAVEVMELLGVSKKHQVNSICGDWVRQKKFKVNGKLSSYFNCDDILDFIDAYVEPMVKAKEKYVLSDWVRIDEGITRKMASLILVEILVEGINRGDDVVKMLVDGVAVIDKIRDHNLKFKMG